MAQLEAVERGSAKTSGAMLAELDRILFQSERHLTLESGLPRRPWFRHHVYAPGFYTGYSVKTLPGVREAIEQGEWAEAEEQIEIAADRLESLAAQLESVATLLGGDR